MTSAHPLANYFAENSCLPLASSHSRGSTLEENLDGSYTLTDKHGQMRHFDSGGLLTPCEDRNGNTIEYTYTSGLLTMITDPLDRETSYAYDSRSRLIKITGHDPDLTGPIPSAITQYAYDAAGQLTTVTDALGGVTSYVYNSRGFVPLISRTPSAISRRSFSRTYDFSDILGGLIGRAERPTLEVVCRQFCRDQHPIHERRWYIDDRFAVCGVPIALGWSR